MLRAVNAALLATPDGLHHQSRSWPSSSTAGWPRSTIRSRASSGRRPRPWPSARSSLEGSPIRLTGQDTVRGTFSQRHLALHDAKTGDVHVPIQHLPDARASFELHNSPLSEYACLGFEYGYAATAPEALVLWEAQYGDFVNGAEIIVDQFIIAGLAKWRQTSRLTLLLPHGYEGSGPGALVGPPRAIPGARRGGQHPGRLPHHPGAVLPRPAPPGASRRHAPDGGDDPQVAAAAAAGGLAAGRPDRWSLRIGPGRSGRGRTRCRSAA